MPYQTFDCDFPGSSDSAGKFAALRIRPEEWKGARVLDVGCNTGYFCHQALRHGAEQVVGIERDTELCEYGPLEILNQSWDDELPEGEFDLILMLSAFHYAEKPLQLLRRLRDKLSVNGKLILEVGINPSSGSTRRADGSVVTHMTNRGFNELLTDAGLTFRWMGRSVDQKGDPVPRSVYHCQRRQPSLLLIRGPSGSGKSSLCNVVEGAVLHLDDIVRRNSGVTDLRQSYQEISDSDELQKAFVEAVLQALPDKPLVTLDCLESMEPIIRIAAQKAGWRVWTATTSTAYGPGPSRP